MTGKIKYMIDTIIENRSQGNPAVVNMIRIKLIFKGIFPEKYTWTSEDDPIIMEKLNKLADELGIEF